MPARAPDPGPAAVALLGAIGDRIRTRRKALKVSVGTTAEAAGMSRVTLHRIERGEASVTMGAYLNAMSALGLELVVRTRNPADPVEPVAAAPPPTHGGWPPHVRIVDYPQLSRAAWGVPGGVVSPREALDLYERGWRHIAPDQMDAHEREFLHALVQEFGQGHLLV